MTWRRFAPAVVAVTLLLAGCGASSDLDADAARDLREVAYSVAELSAAGDRTGALTALAELEGDLQAAQDAGSVSADKARSVQTVIDLVRADLEPSETEAPAPAPAAPVITEIAPPADDVPVETESGDAGTGETETIDPGTDDGSPSENGNKGKGNNNGNGKGGNGKKP